MQCHQCGGALSGVMTFCPYCGVRQDIDLRQIHYRDLGSDGSMPCPSCESILSVIEFDSDPPLRVERCCECQGMFFNPGELQALLNEKTPDLVWLDNVQMDQIGKDFGYNHEVFYKKCPMCSERMSHINFAGKSGVILDRCGTHGLWVEGGELRQLVEWWRAGGKLVFQQHEADKTKRLYGHRPPPRPATPASIDSPEKTTDWWKNHPVERSGWFSVLAGIAEVASTLSRWK